MKSTIVLLSLGLCSLALTGCETSDRGGGYDRAINEGPVGRGPVVVSGRQPDYRDDRYNRGRYDGGGYGRNRADGSGGRYDRGADSRYACRNDPDFDPRYDRCGR